MLDIEQFWLILARTTKRQSQSSNWKNHVNFNHNIPQNYALSKPQSHKTKVKFYPKISLKKGSSSHTKPCLFSSIDTKGEHLCQFLINRSKFELPDQNQPPRTLFTQFMVSLSLCRCRTLSGTQQGKYKKNTCIKFPTRLLHNASKSGLRSL